MSDITVSTGATPTSAPTPTPSLAVARVLFVCHANICRSPLAMALFRQKLRARGLAAHIEVDSAGTHADPEDNGGFPYDPRSVKVAGDGGTLLDGRSKKIPLDTLDQFDRIVVMDSENEASLNALLTDEQKAAIGARIVRMGRYIEPGDPPEIPDPVLGTMRDFELLYKMLDRAADRLLDEVAQPFAAVRPQTPTRGVLPPGVPTLGSQARPISNPNIGAGAGPSGGAGGYTTYLNFAIRLARDAEAAIMPLFQKAAVDIKADGTEVTEADRRAEKVMREAIERRYPSHAILGEEFGTQAGRGRDGEALGEAEYTWVLDPIDGTAAFTLGLPLFGTLIALVRTTGEPGAVAEPVVGVMHFPALREMVYASAGGGCFSLSTANPNAQPVRLKVAPDIALEQAVASATGVHATKIWHKPGQPEADLAALIESVRKFRFVGDCLQYAMVCKGRLHTALDPIVAPWDIAAVLPCVREAGGVASSLSGDERGVTWSKSLVASCGPTLHRAVLEKLNG
jgi:histidinol-phosphatase